MLVTKRYSRYTAVVTTTNTMLVTKRYSRYTAVVTTTNTMLVAKRYSRHDQGRRQGVDWGGHVHPSFARCCS